MNLSAMVWLAIAGGEVVLGCVNTSATALSSSSVPLVLASRRSTRATSVLRWVSAIAPNVRTYHGHQLDKTYVYKSSESAALGGRCNAAGSCAPTIIARCRYCVVTTLANSSSSNGSRFQLPLYIRPSRCSTVLRVFGTRPTSRRIWARNPRRLQTDCL